MKQLKIDLKEGLSKDQVLESFMERNPQNRNKAISYLSSTPDTFYAKKYSLANSVLIGIYSVVTVPVLLIRLLTSGFSSMVVDLTVYFLITYFIFKKNALSYIVLATIMIWSSGPVIVAYLKEPTTIGLLFLLAYSCILVYAFIIKIKLFPKQNLFNLKKDKNGILIFSHI